MSTATFMVWRMNWRRKIVGVRRSTTSSAPRDSLIVFKDAALRLLGKVWIQTIEVSILILMPTNCSENLLQILPMHPPASLTAIFLFMFGSIGGNCTDSLRHTMCMIECCNSLSGQGGQDKLTLMPMRLWTVILPKRVWLLRRLSATREYCPGLQNY